MAERQTGRHRRPPERQATYREVFAVGEFRALWAAQALSFVGDQLAQVALAVLVYEHTGSALLTAVTYALTYLPPIVGGPVLSGLADVFPRRAVMVVCDVVRAGLVAVMAVTAVPFPVLCALLFLTVLLGAPFSAARAAVMPDVLEGDRYVAGSAIGSMTHQGTQMLGFLAGGAIVAAVGTYGALGVDAATFGVSALILFGGLRTRPAPRRRERRTRGLWAGTRDGARLVFGDPALRSLVLFAWLCAFSVIPEGLAPPYAATFGGGAVTVGLLMSAMPTGMVAGAFLFSRFVRPANRLRAMGWMAVLACAPLIGAAARPPLWGVLLLWALAGAGGAYQLAANAAFVAAVPASGRGQAFGLVQSGILAGQGLGILAAGAAAQVLGPQTVVALGGAAGTSAAAVLAIGRHRLLGDMAGARPGPLTRTPAPVNEPSAPVNGVSAPGAVASGATVIGEDGAALGPVRGNAAAPEAAGATMAAGAPGGTAVPGATAAPAGQVAEAAGGSADAPAPSPPSGDGRAGVRR